MRCHEWCCVHFYRIASIWDGGHLPSRNRDPYRQCYDRILAQCFAGLPSKMFFPVIDTPAYLSFPQIGKTSSLVLTLCGVLKDILLVAASMIIWGTPVSGLQFFGYSIALGGLLYYKLGGESIRQYASTAGRSWDEFGTNKPLTRKLVIFGCLVLTMILLLGGLAPTYAPGTVKASTDYLRSLLGGVMAAASPKVKGSKGTA